MNNPPPLHPFVHVAHRILSHESLPPIEIPGHFSTVSREEVKKALNVISSYALIPIRLEPKGDYKDLNDALGKGDSNKQDVIKDDSLSFSEIGR